MRLEVKDNEEFAQWFGKWMAKTQRCASAESNECAWRSKRGSDQEVGVDISMVQQSAKAQPVMTSLTPRLFLRPGLALLLLCWGDLYGDTIVLANGDKLTGEVKSLDDGKVTIKLSYTDHPIIIKASMLASVETNKEMKASLQDGSTVSGKLRPAAVPGSFLAANSGTSIEFKNVASIALLIPEPAPPKTLKDRLATDNSLTYTFMGNSSLTTRWRASLCGKGRTSRPSRKCSATATCLPRWEYTLTA